MGLSSKSQLGLEHHLWLDSISIPFLWLADQFFAANFPSPVFSTSDTCFHWRLKQTCIWKEELWNQRACFMQNSLSTWTIISKDYLKGQPLLRLFFAPLSESVCSNKPLKISPLWCHNWHQFHDTSARWVATFAALRKSCLSPIAAVLSVSLGFWRPDRINFCCRLSQCHNWHFQALDANKVALMKLVQET